MIVWSAVLLSCAQFFAGLVLFSFGNDSGLFLSASGLCIAIMLMPVALRVVSADLFSPLILAAGSVLLGTGLRIPYILAFDSRRTEFLMFGYEFAELAYYVVWVLIGIAAFTVGYSVNRSRFSLAQARVLMRPEIDQKRLVVVSVLCGLVGAVAAIIFITTSGIDLSAGLSSASRKVFQVHTAADGTVVAGAGGIWRFLVKFADVPLIVVICLLLIRSVRPSVPTLAAVGLLAVPALLVPFLTSSRSDIIVVMIAIGIFMYYMKILRIRNIIVGLVLATSIVVVMGQLRAVNMTGSGDGRTMLDAVIGSGNGMDLMRTSAIMKRVPEEVDFLYGSSYASILTAYVPRSVWPGKPDIALGPWVKQEVFGFPVPGNNGWPSGLIAEAYLNFGLLGMPILLFAIGWFFRLVYNCFLPFLGVNPLMTIVYSAIAWRFGFGTMGLNFAHGMVQTLAILVPLLIFMFLISRPVRIHRRHRTAIGPAAVLQAKR